MSRYPLIHVHSSGYKCVGSIEADNLFDACKQHVATWAGKRSAPFALVMRLPTGGRHSVFASEMVVKTLGVQP